MKIVSWNVNSLNVRLPHLEQWLEGFAPDVVGLQETKLEDHKFPAARLAELGWNVVFAGQKTYNGVHCWPAVPSRMCRSASRASRMSRSG
jgi:Exonuclease III